MSVHLLATEWFDSLNTAGAGVWRLDVDTVAGSYHDGHGPRAHALRLVGPAFQKPVRTRSLTGRPDTVRSRVSPYDKGDEHPTGVALR